MGLLRKKGPLVVLFSLFSCSILLFLFQNCGNVNLLSSSEESTEIPTEVTPPSIKQGPPSAVQYECLTNGSVPDGHDGLTMANRMTLGYDHSGHRYPMYSLFFDLTQYNSIVRFPTTTAGPLEEGYGFPGNADMRTQINVEPGKFIALKFRVPSDPSWHGMRGALSFFPAHPTTTPENFIFTNTGVSWSISKCPGQFRSVASAPPIRGVDCTHRAGDNNNTDNRIMWIIEDPERPYQRPQTNLADRCALTPGETYYLNFIPRVDAKTPGSLDPSRINENYYLDLSDNPEDPHYPGWVPPFYSLRFMNTTVSRDNEYMSGQ